jgi:uncharacterized protein YyaL (SSP411 family)
MRKVKSLFVIFVVALIATLPGEPREPVWADGSNPAHPATFRGNEGGIMEKSEQKKMNHLAGQKSPYLLQHVHNPVDWHPWDDEALERARKENKLIFLSIGYSTCHWCHVMEEESFENEELADLLNRDFICIKVDREERPDLDKIYMTAVQAMTGSGGWPLNVFLTPDLKPFFGGTYFPLNDKWGRSGMMSLVPLIAKLWKENPEKITDTGERLSKVIDQPAFGGKTSPLSPALLEAAFRQASEDYDSVYGGFGKAPKFPQAMTLALLLRYHFRTGNGEALKMVEKTLEQMAHGGIYDQLGGGFHRYSTDERWLVPHFEKMLYDNAILSQLYLEAYQVTGKKEYEDIAREILNYVLRDMTDPEGGFYSAEDADSEGEEGTFYVWTPGELEGLLGQEEGQTFGRFYDVTTAGNFEGGKSILHKWIDPGSFSKDRKVPLPKLEDILSRGRRRLLEARSQRVRPHRDDKILTSWNGLMISSFAYAHQVLEEPKYLAAAQNAADFILRNLLTDAGLLRRYRDKEAGISAYLDDYAFLVHGLIELYQATFEPRWIREAISLNRQMIEAYHDPEGKGFFFTRKGDETLLMRTKDFYDSALPSGNAMAILNLFRLSEFTSDQSLKELGLETLEQLSGSLSQAPSAFAQSLIALDFMLSSPMEIAVIGAKEDPGTRSMIWAVRKPFSPGKIVAWSPGGDKNAVKEIPFLEGKIAIEGRPTAYICRNYTCKKPLTDPAEVKKVLTGKEKGG